MWLGRLLLFIVILALLPILQRILAAFFGGLFGRPSRRRTRCPRCGGSGWITAGAGMKKACGCGTVPPEGRGPIIDVGSDKRAAGR
jgi:hypothetical protein